jgi:triosephosphate isomerase
MFKTAAQAVEYVDRFLQLLPSIPQSVEVVVCPTFTALQAVHDALRNNARIKLGAQNMHWEDSGAFTGEISAPMLLQFGVQFVIIGHSERRLYFGETDQYVRLKTEAALKYGLTPIVAVGESLDVRESGRAEKYVTAQVLAALEGFTAEQLAKIVIAYEPIWAIGTGKNCNPADANDIMRAIRACMNGLENVPILYGGSVKPENIAGYCGQSDIDGALVGGASLDPGVFARVCAEVA